MARQGIPQFHVVRYISTATAPTAKRRESQFRTPATPGKGADDIGGNYHPGRHTGTWALLVAGSDGWNNYRHQADVLAQYQRLWAGGAPANHIIVVSANDLAYNEQNPNPGTVRYPVGGPNLYQAAHADYPLEGMTAERLMNILSGRASPHTPKVIRAGRGDNVFFYISGHGNQQGVYLGLGRGVPSPRGDYSVLTPHLLDRTLASMADKHHYRRMLLAVESCQGGVLGSTSTRPARSLSAASPLARRRVLLPAVAGARRNPNDSISQLYQHLYRHVAGSHVSAYGPDFGNPATVPIKEFTAP